MPSKRVVFDADSARRIARVVRRVERTPVAPIGKRGRWPVIQGATPNIKIGVLDADLTYNASATVSIYTGAGGSATDSGDNVTAYCWLLGAGDTIESGSHVVVGYNGDHWEVIAAECPDSGSS